MVLYGVWQPQSGRRSKTANARMVVVPLTYGMRVVSVRWIEKLEKFRLFGGDSASRPGVSADEIEHDTCYSGNTIRPRLVELRRLGSIKKTTATRPTRSGRKAVVWVAVCRSCISWLERSIRVASET